MSTEDAPSEQQPKTEPPPKVDEPKAQPWRKLEALFPLFDFTCVPDTKAGWFLRIGVTALALFVLGRRVHAEVGPMLAAHPPAALPAVEIDDYKFRLPERTRREIFAELATAEIAERQRAIAANTWHGHVWSREDDRGWQERVAARAAAAKYRISLTQVFLVLDEGIRNKWPGPDGKPLAATTPPLNFRKDSW